MVKGILFQPKISMVAEWIDTVKSFSRILTLLESLQGQTEWTRISYQKTKLMQTTLLVSLIMELLKLRLSLLRDHRGGHRCQAKSLLRSSKIKQWCHKMFMVQMAQDSRNELQNTRPIRTMWGEDLNLKWMSSISRAQMLLLKGWRNLRMYLRYREVFSADRISNKFLKKITTQRFPVCNKRALFLMRTLLFLSKRPVESRFTTKGLKQWEK